MTCMDHKCYLDALNSDAPDSIDGSHRLSSTYVAYPRVWRARGPPKKLAHQVGKDQTTIYKVEIWCEELAGSCLYCMIPVDEQILNPQHFHSFYQSYSLPFRLVLPTHVYPQSGKESKTRPHTRFQGNRGSSLKLFSLTPDFSLQYHLVHRK